MKTRIHLYDTTLRDGTQREGISLSASDKVKIAARLDAFGIDTIEGGWPGSNPKDAEFFRRVAEQPPRRARISAFGSTRRVGMSCDEDPSLQALVASNTPVVTIVGKSSATHVRIVLETTREENLRLIADTVAYFRAMGKDVIYDAEHFFDGLALDEVYALETLEAAHDAGASVLVLCDTNGGAEPRVISEAVCRVSRRFRAPLGIHPHNDRGLALANALAAIDAGCVHAQGTVNGYGERCGNLDLLALIANLQLKRGVQCVSDESLATLTELSHCVASIANLAPDAHAPFIGRAAFAHKGGTHVSAVAKEPDMYQHMDPARVGNRMRIVVSELSGRANVRLRASSLGLDAQPVERAVLERVKALEHAGAQLEAAEGTFEMLVRRASPGYVVPFELREYTVVVERRANAGSRARAIVEMRIGDTSVRTQAEGDGPVHALDSAVRLALAPHIPAVLDSQLVDYKVRIINEHLGTAAITRVLIETSYGAERWSTIGAAANLLDASWDAIRDSLELVVARSFDATRHSAPHRMETRRIDRNRHVMMHTMPRTLFAKLWDDHLIQAESESTPAVLYVDLHLVHEVTSPQAFSVLRERGVRVRRTERTLATMDHSTPTTPRGNDGKIPVLDLQARAQLAQLEQNCADFDVPLYTLGSEHQGIVHVIGPELGFTQPGMTIVCGDSHTSTHGDSGALAFGIGTSEVAHVLATQCLLQRRAQTMEVRVDGTLAPGVTAKDLILRLISEIGVGGATGHVLEYTGSAIRALSMEERMTVCNMSIEAGARAGMIAPDDTTYQYLAGRPHAPRGEAWDRALARWRTFTADPGSMHDRTVMLDATSIKPMITYGTNPGMGIAVDAPVPTPSEISDASERRALEKALAYMALQPGEMLLGKPVDVVFLGSCTNSRISDLRLAAAVMRGHRVASTVRMLVVPGSQQVKRQAEAEGLDVIFHAAGAEWREAGCSMCIAMNGDELRPGQYAVSTSNRNFEGRQGKGGRTFLASPLTAAATAIAGSIADARTIVQGN